MLARGRRARYEVRVVNHPNLTFVCAHPALASCASSSSLSSYRKRLRPTILKGVGFPSKKVEQLRAVNPDTAE